MEIRRLFGRSVASAGIRAAHASLEILTVVLLARLLTAEHFGAYSGATALAAVAATVLALGLPVALVKLLPKYRSSGQEPLARGCVAWSYYHAIVISALVLLALVLAGLYIPSGSRWYTLYLLSAAAVPFLVLSLIQRGIMQGMEHIIASQVPEYVIRPGVVACMALLLALAPESMRNAVSAAAAAFLAALAAAAAGFIFVKNRSNRDAGRRAYRCKKWYVLSRSLFAGQLATIASAYQATLLVTVLCGPSEAGVYRVAFAAAAAISLPLVAVSGPLAPTISRMFHQSNTAGLRKVTTFGARLSFALAAILAVPLILYGSDIVRFVFGDEYDRASLPVSILAVGHLLNVACGPVGFILQMTGGERLYVAGVGTAAIVQLALTLALAPVYGAVGAAAAYTVSTAAWNLALVVICRKKIAIDPTFLGMHAR